MTTPRLRFAPSPTGFMHLGNARTALFNWLYARHTGGQFLLRIEDTDRERHNEHAVQVIKDSLAWLGCHWDNPDDVVFQSTRFDHYRQHAEKLIETGHAYRCILSREELDAARENPAFRDATGLDRPTRRYREAGLGPDCGTHVIRFKTPLTGESVFEDIVQGTIRKGQDELDDFIIIRSDGTPTYQFAVVIDDHDMEITHICRGADHIDNTHDQVNLYKAFGWTPPRFAHAPRILGLSKRKGSPSLEAYREELALCREGLVNYLARLGWSHGDDELFDIDQLIAVFTLDGINRPNGNFDVDKLIWFNQQHIQRIPYESLLEQAASWFQRAGVELDLDPQALAATETGLELDAWRQRVFALTRPRATNLRDLVDVSRYFFTEPTDYAEKAVKKWLGDADSASIVSALAERLAQLPAWEQTAIMSVFEGLCSERELKMGKVAQPARIALTGDAASPGIDETTFLVGRARAVARLERLADWLAARSA